MSYIILLMKVSFLVAAISWSTVQSECQVTKSRANEKNKQLTINLDKSVYSVAFSPDGNVFAAGGVNGSFKLWETKSWTVKFQLDHSNSLGVNGIAFSPASNIVATQTNDLAKGGRTDAKVWFWNVDTGENISTYKEDSVPRALTSIAYSPNGKLMAIGFGNGTVRLLNIEDVKNIKVINENLTSFKDAISSINFSPDGRLLAVGSKYPAILLKVIEVETEKEVYSNTSGIIVYHLEFSPDGKTLATVGRMGRDDNSEFSLKLFNTDSWEMTADIRNHNGSEGLHFSPSGNSLILVSLDKFEVFDLRSKKFIKSIKSKSEINHSSLSPDGKNIALGDDQGNIQFYSISEKK